jgi:hypothetical protein
MYQRGEKHAAEARKVMTDLLIPLQSREGWWDGIGGEERSARAGRSMPPRSR